MFKVMISSKQVQNVELENVTARSQFVKQIISYRFISFCLIQTFPPPQLVIVYFGDGLTFDFMWCVIVQYW